MQRTQSVTVRRGERRRTPGCTGHGPRQALSWFQLILRPVQVSQTFGKGGGDTEDALLAAAVLCAMRHRYNYRGYESAGKATAALRRRCRGVARQQVEAAFVQGAALYARAEEVVWANRHVPAEQLGDLVPMLRGEFPGAGAAVVRDALTWAHYWRVLR